MNTLVDQRCFNHNYREAVAVCPHCRRCFCRECVTEHDDIMFCASCMKKISRPSLIRRFHFSGLLNAGQCIVGFFLAWMFFYYLGQMLLAIPSAFHEGSVWQVEWWLNAQ